MFSTLPPGSCQSFFYPFFAHQNPPEKMPALLNVRELFSQPVIRFEQHCPQSKIQMNPLYPGEPCAIPPYLISPSTQPIPERKSSVASQARDGPLKDQRPTDLLPLADKHNRMISI